MKKTLQYLTLGCLFLIPFIPLVVSNTLFFPFISGKNFAFRTLVEIAFAAWVIWALLEPTLRPRWSLMLKTFAIFVAAVFLADIFGVNVYKSFWSNFERMEGFVSIAHLFLYFLTLTSVLKNRDLWYRLFHVSLGVSIFTALYALLQVSGVLTINQGGLRVDATLGNAIYFAVYLLLHTGLALYLWLIRKTLSPLLPLWSLTIGSALYVLYYLVRLTQNGVAGHTLSIILFIVSLALLGWSAYKIWQSRASSAHSFPTSSVFGTWLYPTLAVVHIIFIVLTATRGVLVGMVGGAVVLALLLLWAPRVENPSERRWFRTRGVVLAVLLTLAVGGFFAVREITVVRQHRILGRIASISLQNDDAKARLMVWDMALRGFKERPILGWGQENFNYVFNKYYNPNMFAREQWFDRTHSIFFDWIIAGGIVGLLAYLSLYASALYLLWRRRTAFAAGERIILTTLIAAYFIQNIFVFDNLTSYLLFGMLLAYIASVSAADGKGAPVSPAFEQGVIKRLYVPLVLVIFLALSYFITVRPVLAGTLLLKGLRQQQGGLEQNLEIFKRAIAYYTFATPEIREQLVQVTMSVAGNQAVPDEIKEKFFELAATEMKKQSDSASKDARFALFLGALYNRYGLYDQGVAELKRALELSPQKQMIMIELGSSLLNQSKADEAVSYFKKAYDLAPEFDEVRIIYAIGAIYAREDTLVKELLEMKSGSIHHPDPRVARAYFDTGQYMKSVETWKKIVEGNPGKAENYLFLAGAQLQNGEVRNAIASIRTAIELDSSLKTAGEDYISRIQAGER